MRCGEQETGQYLDASGFLYKRLPWGGKHGIIRILDGLGM